MKKKDASFKFNVLTISIMLFGLVLVGIIIWNLSIVDRIGELESDCLITGNCAIAYPIQFEGYEEVCVDKLIWTEKVIDRESGDEYCFRDYCKDQFPICVRHPDFCLLGDYVDDWKIFDKCFERVFNMWSDVSDYEYVLQSGCLIPTHIGNVTRSKCVAWELKKWS